MSAPCIGLHACLTGTAIVALRGDAVIEQRVWKPERAARGLDRLLWFRGRFHALFSAYPDATVAVEGYPSGVKNGREAAGELGAVVRLAAHDCGIPAARYLVVPTTAARKFVTGRGSADGAILLLHVFKKFGFETEDRGIASAYVLARIAQLAQADGHARPLASVLTEIRMGA